jgi:RHS repeat-associated protein
LRDKPSSPLLQLDARTYEWRGEDQIAAIIDAQRGPTFYQHDARGRLVSQVTPQGTLHRSMDAVGNVVRSSLSANRRYGRGSRLEEADSIRYSHDEDGNQTERIEADGKRWRYRWNGAGMLSELERPDGLKVRFEYDTFARRTRKMLVRSSPDGSETVEGDTRFVWDGHTLVHELPAGASVATWYFEPDTFTPVALEREGHRWDIVSDHLGTPTEMYDGLGQLAWRMQIDAFGVKQTDVALQHCPWRWPGQYEDEETGLHYNRYRYYDAQAGRYISQDPLGLAAGLQLYGYPEDPLVTVDPLGLTQQNCGLSPRAARRRAMREAGIPTSLQPTAQRSPRVPGTNVPGGRQYTYHVPAPGGGTQTMSVQHSLTDRVPGHGPHWEAGPVKLAGQTDGLGRPRLQSSKVKVEE